MLICALILLISLFFNPCFAQELKSPEEFLGYRVGADYKIADYETIQNYFKMLSKASNKILYEDIGKTSMGRDMFMAVISSEDNIKNIDQYREIIKTLSDPRKINEEKASKLAKDGKIVVLVTCNIHSTEIASSQMSMELAYDLITNKAPEKALRGLDDVIFILMPSINPDGTTMVVDWYNKYLNTEFEGSPMPYLYQLYSGHDNNRDWFMFNLPETRNVINIAYHKWFPQIWLDEHQMGSTGARLFVVPYMDPINPNVNPLIWRWQKVIGGLTSLRLEQQNLTGIIDQAYFEGWWQGPASDCGLWHNQISLLSEMASCNIASPIYIDPSEVKVTEELTTYDIRTNYSSPWRGGWWRLRDIVEYELALTYTLIEAAAQFKEEILFNYYSMAKDAVEKGKAGDPFAFIIPRNQNDPVTVSKMIETLQLGGVEVYFKNEEFTIGRAIYPAETYVIYTSQPNGRYVKDLFEEQNYPDLRKSREEKPIRPYDVAGWTLPYLMGVKYYTIEKPFELQASLLNQANYQNSSIEEQKGNFYVLPSGLNINSALINRMHKEDIPVYWNTEKIKINGTDFLPGSVFIEVEDTREILNKAAAELHLKIVSADVDKAKLKEIKSMKIGLYQPFTANMDEGWTRLLLKNYEFEFTSMHNEDFKKQIKNNFDVIIIPEMRADLLKDGKYTGENERFNRIKPPEYQGGIDKEGVENLKKFIEEDGGIVITLGEACNFAIEDLGLKVTNVLKNSKPEEFFCPGSLVKMNIDNTHPIGYGMEEEFGGYVTSNIAFSTQVPYGQYDRSVIARYPDKDILMSGYLLGEDFLYKKAAVVDVKQKKGHAVLIGFKPQNRHWTYGTFKILFNAIHSAGMYQLD